ncbi:MAG TPA: cupredoxin family copper-binding protein [Gemmatimonadaceae bacterium]|nr:cupredoxin family copper-binding protein [Gemmatimonadaceae bacterium]
MRTIRASRALARGAAVLLGAVLLSAPGAARPRAHVVKITGFEFVPPRITVAVGDTLTWWNDDIVPHTATAIAGAWDSGTIAAKGRATVVIRAPGRVDYQCALHPSMKGLVVAE